jgi:Cu(I)/Ag(I) efflux system membrane protein CusA/SilA
MVGGMVSAVVLTLLVLPAVYFLWRRQSLKHLTLDSLITDYPVNQPQDTEHSIPEK